MASRTRRAAGHARERKKRPGECSSVGGKCLQKQSERMGWIFGGYGAQDHGSEVGSEDIALCFALCIDPLTD